MVDAPARGALIGAAAGLVAAVLTGAAEPDQVVLASASLGAIAGCWHARRSIVADPLVQLLLALAILRYGAYELSHGPVVAGTALAVGTLLVVSIVVSWLRRRRLRRTTSRP